MRAKPTRPGRAGGPGEDPDTFFFLSFAESIESDDDLVATFFEDLRGEVRVAAGTRRSDPAPTGFLSIAGLRLGAGWSEKITAALGSCRVFVALCSPTYFRSPSCGREWQAFADRMESHRLRTRQAAPSLLPLCWVPTPVPAVVSHIQYVDRSLSPGVHRVGLRQLMRIGRHHDDYQDLLSALASHIVTTARAFPLTPSAVGPDFDRLPFAFPEPLHDAPAKQTAPANEPVGLPDLGAENDLPRLGRI